jgi:hypothetical protein
VEYHRGHIFGRGRNADETTTIGLSSLSKVWRLESTKIPSLVRWCQSLARDIANATPFKTGIALDHLDAGHDITELPSDEVIAADWRDDLYRNPPKVLFLSEDGTEQCAPLIDFDLVVEQKQPDTNSYLIDVKHDKASTRLTFSPNPFPIVNYTDGAQPRWKIERGIRSLDFAEFLTDYPLRFYLANGALLDGCQLFEAPAEDDWYDADMLMQVVDWDAKGVDIQREYGEGTPPLCSIHDWLRDTLVESDAVVVFYDHRSGECADFLTVEVDEAGLPIIKLYHCKGAGGATAGDRVGDVYEVCGQATKSIQWRNKERLIQQIKNRNRTGSVFCKGDLKTFLQLVEPSPRYEFPLKVYAVQPGVSKSKLSPKISSLFATTSRGLVAAGCERLYVICSS